MILVDTSIRINHFRYDDVELSKIIEDDRLLCHPFIIGGLALESPRERDAVIEFLAGQREVVIATHAEVMTVIDRYPIFRMGIGYADAHLQTSILLDRRASLSTSHRRLASAVQKVGVTVQHTPTRREYTFTNDLEKTATRPDLWN